MLILSPERRLHGLYSGIRFRFRRRFADEKRYYKNFHLDYTGSAVETGKTGMGGAGEAVASTAKKDAFSVECVFLRVRGH